MITDLHILDAWKQTYNAVGIQFLQAELNARKHDVGCTGRNQVDVRSVILPRLDPASRKLTDDLVAIDDEASANDGRHFGEAELSSLAHELFCALIGIAGPRAAQLDGIDASSQCEQCTEK